MQSLATISEQCFDRYWKGMMLNASECVGLGAGMIEDVCAMDCQYGSQVESRMNNRELVRSARFFCGLYFLCRLVAMGVSNLQTFHSLTGTLWYAFAEKKQRAMHIAGMKPLSEKLVLGPRPLSFVPCCFDFVF